MKPGKEEKRNKICENKDRCLKGKDIWEKKKTKEKNRKIHEKKKTDGNKDARKRTKQMWMKRN